MMTVSPRGNNMTRLESELRSHPAYVEHDSTEEINRIAKAQYEHLLASFPDHKKEVVRMKRDHGKKF